MYGGALKPNPRRRRRRSHRRRRSRRSHRRYRSHRGYLRNPGGFLIDLAKKAAPVLIGLYGARLLVSKIGPMLPMVGSLGTFQGPALAIGAVLLTNFATKKVAFLAKHREPLLIGVGLAALDSLVSAFAPASVKSLIGVGDMGDYLAVGDYVQLGAVPLNDQMTMSDYVAVGAVEEELGLDEELGVDEELGGMAQGGIGGGPGYGGLTRPIPPKAFLSPVPARSFTQAIQPASTSFDSDQIYAGVFRGGF